jgi:hypothetical protein
MEKVSARRAAGSALSEFVCDCYRGDVFPVGILGRKRRKRPFDLTPHTADSNAEYPLTTANQVNDLIGAAALIDARAIAHQGDPCKIIALTTAQVINCRANVLQGNPGVNESLDNPQDQYVPEAVQPLSA